MKHLIHVLLVVFAATAGTLLLGAGASASSLLAGFGFAAVATVVVVPLGVATLIAAGASSVWFKLVASCKWRSSGR